jgi:hypothetical protein
MMLSLRMTMCADVLPVSSEYYESILRRSERLLRQPRYQRALRLLSTDSTEYRGQLDWIHATLSPSWRPHVLAYYRDEGPPLREQVDEETIDRIDREVERALIELSASYRQLQRAGWLDGRGSPTVGPLVRRLATAAARQFLTPRFPTQPAWCVVENVASGASKWVDPVCRSLERLGYSPLPIPIAARDVGAPHIRRRIFVVAAAPHAFRRAAGAPGVAADSDQGQLQSGRVRAQGRRRPGGGGSTTADALRAGLQGRGSTQQAGGPEPAAGPWAVDQMPEPSVRRVDDGPTRRLDGASRKRRIRALGNAVVPQCAQVVGEVIKQLMVR